MLNNVRDERGFYPERNSVAGFFPLSLGWDSAWQGPNKTLYSASLVTLDMLRILNLVRAGNSFSETEKTTGFYFLSLAWLIA